MPTTTPLASIDALDLTSVLGGCGKKRCCRRSITQIVNNNFMAPPAAPPAAAAPPPPPSGPSVETSVNVSYQ